MQEVRSHKKLPQKNPLGLMLFYIHCIQLKEIAVAKKLHQFSANKINEAKNKVTNVSLASWSLNLFETDP